MTLYTVDTLLSLVLLSVLFAFGSSRVPALIKVMAFQGIVVSIIPFFITPDMETGAVIFTLATLVIRGAVIPLSLHIAIKKWPSSGRCPRLWGTMPLCSAGWA